MVMRNSRKVTVLVRPQTAGQRCRCGVTSGSVPGTSIYPRQRGAASKGAGDLDIHAASYTEIHRAQELCESRGSRPELPVPNKSGFCERKATLKQSFDALLNNKSFAIYWFLFLFCCFVCLFVTFFFLFFFLLLIAALSQYFCL